MSRHATNSPLGLLPFFLLLLTAVIRCSPSHASSTFDIRAFGAKPDGQTDSAQAFAKAWAAACGSSGPSTVYVPAGSFMVGQVAFSGPCRSSGVTVQIDGTLVSTSNYAEFGTKGDWILLDHVDGVSVHGGVIDGRGAPLWSCKASGGRSCPDGATSLKFLNSKNAVISGLTSVDSELYHIVIDGCQGVTVQGVRISAPGNSPNTDGVHIQMSTGVTVTNAGIKTGDDCISVGPGTADLWIEQVSCGPGHGISIGSLGKENSEEGVQNVTVKSTVFTGTENGLRIKTWGRPSDGFVRGVVFDHAIMQDVHNPIIIDQHYCPGDVRCPGQNSGVKISEVSYTDIHGSSATEVALNFDCSSISPCTGIGLQDIQLTYGGQQSAVSSCIHADGSVTGPVQPPSCL